MLPPPEGETLSDDILLEAGSPPTTDAKRLVFDEVALRRNHQVFRYPAKFHPPVAKALIEEFSRPGETVLDPFCGSGTVLVEALAAGRRAVGTDVDPLAVFITKAKIRRHDVVQIERKVNEMTTRIAAMREADLRLWGSLDSDIPMQDYESALSVLQAQVPQLPRIEHWFRRRVVLQLAALRSLLGTADASTSMFLRLCFASIIRNTSNADPVPVSGLEVTSHMLAKELAGRSIDPYDQLTAAMRRCLAAMQDFELSRTPSVTARAANADARRLSMRGTGPVDCVITSPPYLAAVDYYRRHTLEMYWLGLTADADERLQLMGRYIGRDKVGIRHMGEANDGKGLAAAERHLGRHDDVKPERARAFRHYCASMSQAMARLTDILPSGARMVLVVGDVRFTGRRVSMVDLLAEVAPDRLRLNERLWYPLANRYMSYARKHDADIDKDHVLVFRKA